MCKLIVYSIVISGYFKNNQFQSPFVFLFPLYHNSFHFNKKLRHSVPFTDWPIKGAFLWRISSRDSALHVTSLIMREYRFRLPVEFMSSFIRLGL